MKTLECVEVVLKFILECSIDGSLELDIGLSNAFCSALLVNDSTDSLLDSSSTAGVPPYPLYKHIALALWETFNSATFFPKFTKVSMVNGEIFLKQKEKEWLKLIMDKGSEMVQVLETLGLEFHVQEPFFSQLKDGQKSVEGRCALGEYDRIEPGTLMIFNKCLVFEISDVRRYESFSDMLEAENLQSILPGVDNIEEGLEILKSLNGEEKETGLGYEGLQRLLGLTHTVATVVDALPPPRSALLSSFMLPYKPEGKGTKLTHGARALAKHSHRSSNKYWGTLDGSDSNKNRLAVNTIFHLISHSCWLNIHIVAPHGIVFEIRVADGYGARWSKDGTKFIGFLEPYMEDGHLKGWKH